MLDRTSSTYQGVPALSITGLSVAYRDKPALSAVDATFPAGAVSAVIGPNGAGKSTLLKAAMGMVPVITGEVRFFGEPIEAARHRVAYVPQRASVDWDFPATVMDVVLMGLYARIGAFRFIGQAERDEALACLREVDMEPLAGRQIGQLSGGQQQRVFLARALAQRADLLILDEPLAGVDAATERTIVALLGRLSAEGKAVIVVHHDLSTVRDYYDHLLVLNIKAIANGPTRLVFNDATLSEAYGGRLGFQVAPVPATLDEAEV